MKNIRVLIVDDSLLMRRIISDLISSERGMEVIATAKDGLEAVEMTAEMRPDVVLMDILMPKMDGLSALSHIMEKNPTPVVMLSSLDVKDADIVLQSLERGAVDFVSKPSGKSVTLFREEEVKRIFSIVKNAASANISPPKPAYALKETEVARKPSFPSPPIITIGASTGGPKRIMELLTYLPRDIQAYILVVQHMPPGFTRTFAERLGRVTGHNVVEAQDGELLAIGKVLVAPGDHHMAIEKQGAKSYAIRIGRGAKVNNVRPSVDVTMESVAKVFGPNSIGILLTGMGSDGAKGMLAIKGEGGKTIAEDMSSCSIYGMPKAAVELGCVDRLVPIQRITPEIMKLLT